MLPNENKKGNGLKATEINIVALVANVTQEKQFFSDLLDIAPVLGLLL